MRSSYAGGGLSLVCCCAPNRVTTPRVARLSAVALRFDILEPDLPVHWMPSYAVDGTAGHSGAWLYDFDSDPVWGRDERDQHIFAQRIGE